MRSALSLPLSSCKHLKIGNTCFSVKENRACLCSSILYPFTSYVMQRHTKDKLYQQPTVKSLCTKI